MTSGASCSRALTVSPMTGSNSGPEMEAADDGVQLLHAGEPLGVAADVDDARVPAAGEHDQPAPGDVSDQRLVVQDQRVGLPALAAPGLVDSESLLESGNAVDLASDQHRPVVQERRLPLLDDAEAGVFQRAAAGGGQLERLAAWDGQAPPSPELGVDQHRQVPGRAADEAGQPGGVVEVAVAADDRLDVCRILAQAAQVAGAPVGRDPGVKQQPRTRPPLRTSTSAENPCWASGTSAALPPTIVGASSSGASRPSRPAGAASPGPRPGAVCR